MADSKKASRRIGAPASTSQKKMGAAGSSASQRGVIKASGRLPVMKKPEAPPAEEAPVVDGEPLFDEDDEIEPVKPKPIDADPSLLSEDSLYSDEDPLEKLKQQKKASIKPKAEPSSSTSGKSNVRPSVKSAPALPAKNSGSTVMKAAPAKSSAAVSAKAKAAPPAAEAPAEEEAAAEAVEQPAEEPAEEAEAAPQKSSRQTLKATARMKAASGKSTARLKEADTEEEEEDDEPRISRRKTKRSIRSGAPKGISKKTLILGGIVVVALLVVAIGYGPFMRSWHIKTLDAPESTAAARKSAVDALFKNYPNDAYIVFSAKERLASEDASIREAVAHGLALMAEARMAGTSPVERLSEELAAASNADAKKLYVKTLNTISKELRENKTGTKDEKEGPPNENDAKNLSNIAAALIACSGPQEKETGIREAALDGLGELRLPGVCLHLFKIATEEKGALRNTALAGVKATALPDAIGALLHGMQSEDKLIAETAKAAFVRVRDDAKSEELLRLINDPSTEVRREIVEALGKRKSDGKATEGITIALKDKDAAIRTLAVKAVPTTNVTNGQVNVLAPLVTDPDEGVRIATAETLSALRDQDSYKLILGAFKNGFEGKTLDAYTKALGKRSYGKDLKACEILIGLLNSNPAGEKTIREALVLVTVNGVNGRENQRRGWSVEKWKQWFATISEREKMREKANAAIKELKKHINADRNTFPGLFKKVETEMNALEKASEMSKPDDAEDVKLIDNELKDASTLKEYFMKGSSFDMR
ncbi:MAG TPA: HEAT repeat domain-containing protein [Planctomycetota bacterium]|nr:HEAT repeat domain-containing protein [Planctomycetota bacterium]